MGFYVDWVLLISPRWNTDEEVEAVKEITLRQLAADFPNLDALERASESPAAHVLEEMAVDPEARRNDGAKGSYWTIGATGNYLDPAVFIGYLRPWLTELFEKRLIYDVELLTQAGDCDTWTSEPTGLLHSALD